MTTPPPSARGKKVTRPRIGGCSRHVCPCEVCDRIEAFANKIQTDKEQKGRQP